MRKMLLGLAVAAIAVLSFTATACAQLDAALGYKKMFLVPTDEQLPTEHLDLLSGSVMWTIPTTDKSHLWMLWGVDEDDVGEVLVGYGWDTGAVDWGLGPTFYWFNNLGQDEVFALGVQAKLGFNIPAGEGGDVPAVFTVGWSRTIRPARFETGDVDYHALTVGLRTDFPVRR